MKRLFSLLLSLALTLSLVPAARAADDADPYGTSTAAPIYVAPPADHKDGLLKFSDAAVIVDSKGNPATITDYAGNSLSTASVAALLNNECRNVAKSNGDTTTGLNYISYISLSPNEGTLYDGYIAESDPGAGVAGLQRYYYNDANANRKLEDIQFAPNTAFTGQAQIAYYGYYTFTNAALDDDGNPTTLTGQRTYSGRIYITVGKQEPGISYSTDGEPVRFSAEDFAAYSLAYTGRMFRYITFTLPDAKYGALYYNYLSESIYDASVSASMGYYRSTNPSVDKVSFVPNPAFRPANGRSESFILPFSGIDIAGSSISGNITITITAYGPTRMSADAASGALTYEVTPGGSVSVEPVSEFTALCHDELGGDFTFSRIRLMDLPSSFEGVLYYGGGTTTAQTAYDYYASSSPYISSLRFEAYYNFEGTVTVPFRGYGTRNATVRYFDGTLTFVVSRDGGASPLHYTVEPGKRVYFERDDFYSVARMEMNGSSLNRIRFASLPPSSDGTLYFLSGSKVTSVSAGTDYSYSNLSNLSFLASSGFTGSVTVPFTGYSYANYSSGYVPTNARAFNGTVTIESTVSDAPQEIEIGGTAGALVYSTTGPAVALRQSDLVNAASSALSGAPATFTLTRPAADAGTLCLDFVSLSGYSVLDPALTYPISDVSRVSFLPKAGFSGSTQISYTVRDAKGNSYTGNLRFVVTPPVYSRYFSDMGDYPWAIPAADFFRYYGTTNGNSRTGFGPSSAMRRGDFILLLSRACSFPSAGTASFSDVPENKYYAAAIAGARALGVVTGNTSGRFDPDTAITREDAALYLYRALRRVKTVAPGAAADLAQFSDGGSVSAYAVEAMGALVRLGVFVGDAGRLRPRAQLNRAETITILYRALT
ncbi:MAG: S-layer homology domain-containing protein [Oscillospiraceae bacterium]|nr:S-layer homology domain-containing protein [Oscillospiraceae bacterium]